jgi:hypothetical protein
MGNWWLFTGISCQNTAPWQFYLTLTYVVLSYIVILFPVLLIVAIIFCLPVVLVLLRLFQRLTGYQFGLNLPTEGQGPQTQSADETVIRQIEKVAYKAGTDINEEDANCVICLGTYTEGEELKRLPGCLHHFHAGCVDEVGFLMNKPQ